MKIETLKSHEEKVRLRIRSLAIDLLNEEHYPVCGQCKSADIKSELVKLTLLQFELSSIIIKLQHAAYYCDCLISGETPNLFGDEAMEPEPYEGIVDHLRLIDYSNRVITYFQTEEAQVTGPPYIRELPAPIAKVIAGRRDKDLLEAIESEFFFDALQKDVKQALEAASGNGSPFQILSLIK